MRKLLIIVGLLFIAFIACKKEADETVIVNVHDTIHVVGTTLVNPDTLSAGIKVAHGIRVTGSFPAASADATAPVLDTLYQKTYSVVRSRYLIIYPPNMSGNIKGYYVQIKGASSYFKVDYTQAYNMRGNGTGFVDSTILIKLPATIRGDTFYVKYAAYDSLNKVSAAVTGRVLVLPEGSDAQIDSLAHNWRFLATRYYANGFYTSDWVTDTGSVEGYTYFKCYQNFLYNGTAEDHDYYLPTTIYYKRTYMNLGRFTYNYTSTSGDKSLQRNSCSNISYDDYGGFSFSKSGSYVFDPIGRKFLIVYEDTNSNIALNYETYVVSELTDSTLILKYNPYDPLENVENGAAFSKYIR